MLEDVGKIDWVEFVMDKAKPKKIFIYNHINLSFLRIYTQRKEPSI
jgi:hypothetical protein